MTDVDAPTPERDGDQLVKARDVDAGRLESIVRPLFASSADLYVTGRAHAALTDGAALIAEAEADAARIRETARQEGLARGLARAAELVAAAEANREAQLRAARDDVAVLAVATARKILDRALVDPEQVIALVEQALDEAAAARHVRIRVGPIAPEDLAEARARLSAGRPDARLEVEVDEALGPGDCVLDTDVGTVDARLELQLDALLEALLAGGSP